MKNLHIYLSKLVVLKTSSSLIKETNLFKQRLNSKVIRDGFRVSQVSRDH